MGRWTDGRSDEIDPVNQRRRTEQRSRGSSREYVLFHGESARAELAFQDLTHVLMIGSPDEPRHRELAEQQAVVSHRARARSRARDRLRTMARAVAGADRRAIRPPPWPPSPPRVRASRRFPC